MPTMDLDRTHRALGYEECLRLLASAGIGRLAYTRSALPEIRPVSFTLRGENVVISAPIGSPLLDAVRGAIVAFESDAYDAADRTGWTVSVVGPSKVVEEGGTAGGASAPPGSRLIAVQLGVVRGWWTFRPSGVAGG